MINIINSFINVCSWKQQNQIQRQQPRKQWVKPNINEIQQKKQEPSSNINSKNSTKGQSSSEKQKQNYIKQGFASNMQSNRLSSSKPEEQLSNETPSFLRRADTSHVYFSQNSDTTNKKKTPSLTKPSFKQGFLSQTNTIEQVNSLPLSSIKPKARLQLSSLSAKTNKIDINQSYNKNCQQHVQNFDLQQSITKKLNFDTNKKSNNVPQKNKNIQQNESNEKSNQEKLKEYNKKTKETQKQELESFQNNQKTQQEIFEKAYTTYIQNQNKLEEMNFQIIQKQELKFLQNILEGTFEKIAIKQFIKKEKEKENEEKKNKKEENAKKNKNIPTPQIKTDILQFNVDLIANLYRSIDKNCRDINKEIEKSELTIKQLKLKLKTKLETQPKTDQPTPEQSTYIQNQNKLEEIQKQELKLLQNTLELKLQETQKIYKKSCEDRTKIIEQLKTESSIQPKTDQPTLKQLARTKINKIQEQQQQKEQQQQQKELRQQQPQLHIACKQLYQAWERSFEEFALLLKKNTENIQFLMLEHLFSPQFKNETDESTLQQFIIQVLLAPGWENNRFKLKNSNSLEDKKTQALKTNILKETTKFLKSEAINVEQLYQTSHPHLYKIFQEWQGQFQEWQGQPLQITPLQSEKLLYKTFYHYASVQINKQNNSTKQQETQQKFNVFLEKVRQVNKDTKNAQPPQQQHDKKKALCQNLYQAWEQDDTKFIELIKKENSNEMHLFLDTLLDPQFQNKMELYNQTTELIFEEFITHVALVAWIYSKKPTIIEEKFKNSTSCFVTKKIQKLKGRILAEINKIKENNKPTSQFNQRADDEGKENSFKKSFKKLYVKFQNSASYINIRQKQQEHLELMVQKNQQNTQEDQYQVDIQRIDRACQDIITKFGTNAPNKTHKISEKERVRLVNFAEFEQERNKNSCQERLQTEKIIFEIQSLLLPDQQYFPQYTRHNQDIKLKQDTRLQQYIEEQIKYISTGDNKSEIKQLISNCAQYYKDKSYKCESDCVISKFYQKYYTYIINEIYQNSDTKKQTEIKQQIQENNTLNQKKILALLCNDTNWFFSYIQKIQDNVIDKICSIVKYSKDINNQIDIQQALAIVIKEYKFLNEVALSFKNDKINIIRLMKKVYQEREEFLQNINQLQNQEGEEDNGVSRNMITDIILDTQLSDILSTQRQNILDCKCYANNFPLLREVINIGASTILTQINQLKNQLNLQSELYLSQNKNFNQFQEEDTAKQNQLCQSIIIQEQEERQFQSPATSQFLNLNKEECQTFSQDALQNLNLYYPTKQQIIESAESAILEQIIESAILESNKNHFQSNKKQNNIDASQEIPLIQSKQLTNESNQQQRQRSQSETFEVQQEQDENNVKQSSDQSYKQEEISNYGEHNVTLKKKNKHSF